MLWCIIYEVFYQKYFEQFKNCDNLKQTVIGTILGNYKTKTDMKYYQMSKIN